MNICWSSIALFSAMSSINNITLPWPSSTRMLLGYNMVTMKVTMVTMKVTMVTMEVTMVTMEVTMDHD